MASLDTAAAMLRLPEDCYPEYGITVVAYMDEEGEGHYGFATHGEQVVRSSLIGLMHMVAHDLTHMAQEGE